MPRFKLRAAVASSVALAVLGSFAACSSDDDPPASTGSGDEPARAVEVTVKPTVGKAYGRVSKSDRAQLLAGIGAVIERWWQNGYVALGDADQNAAFGGFTPAARRLAKRDLNVTTNAGLEGFDAIAIGQHPVVVDILAPGGTPSGATARVRLVMKLSGDSDRTDVVKGRVFFTREKKEWKVFGFDLDRGRQGGEA